MKLDNMEQLKRRYDYTQERVDEQVFKHGNVRGLAVFLAMSFIGVTSLSTRLIMYVYIYLEILVREEGLKYFADGDEYAYNPNGDL